MPAAILGRGGPAAPEPVDRREHRAAILGVGQVEGGGPDQVVGAMAEEFLPGEIGPGEPPLYVEDREQDGREAEESVERLLDPPLPADVADDGQPERLGLDVDPGHAHVDRQRLRPRADQAVTLLRVEEGRVAVGRDQPVEGRGDVGDDQVGQAEGQGIAAIELGEPERGRIHVDHAEVVGIEDEQGIVRLAEQAAGDLQLPESFHGLSPHGAPWRPSCRAVVPIAIRKPWVKWARSGGSGIREADLVLSTPS